MALFVVNRYLGEDGEEYENRNKKDDFEKLLEKVEKRRKLKQNETVEEVKKYDKIKRRFNDELNEKLEQGNDIGESKKKNKRKRKLNDSELVVDTANKEGGTVEKIKRKRKTLNDVSLNSTEELISNEENSTNEIKSIDYRIDVVKNHLVSPNEESSLLNVSGKQNKHSESRIKKIKKKRKSTDSEVSEKEEQFDKEGNTEKKINKNKRSTSFNSSEVKNDMIQDHVMNGNFNSENIIPEDLTTENQPEFTVIGGHSFKHKSAIKRVLPEWLSKPILISGSFKDKAASIENIQGFDKILINNLKKNNIHYFFPVQQKVIPWVLAEKQCSGPGLRFWSRDICVSAPTGSGKTLAFVLPIIQRLRKRFLKRIGALVVVPVQDLAAQVAQVFNQYTIGTGLHVLSVTGKAMPLQQEQKLLVYHKAGVGYESLVDIMVTTPGRLVEHIKETPGFSLCHLKFLVIDEADRVIDNIKNDWLYHLENHITSGGVGAVPPLSLNSLYKQPLRPQKLLFSATLTQDPEKLKQINLFHPRLFVHKTSKNDDCDSESTGIHNLGSDALANQIIKPVELEEQWIECKVQLKPIVLYHILATKNWRGVLCFTHFTDATHRLARLLHYLSTRDGSNLKIEEISSERSFNDRHRILSDFRAGKVDILVCTDVYARGMDILEVRYVVLYSPPVHTRNYVHQVGRTARAGMKGTALALLTPPQVKLFHKMVKSTGHSDLSELKIAEKELAYLEKPYKKALRSLKKETLKEKESAKKLVKLKKRKNFVHHNRNNVKKSNNKSNQNMKEVIRKKLKSKKSKDK
ncbi:putative ATP-dependent RNA helicase Dbp73D isoform X1 [Lycorma delicatula]|uniref:putative ATP-dependent RNA helicase Dbp73D isoform X1 n=1 Tax=Lycorma delicatula TaxID=130591 RepID=UPI003F511193